MRIILSFFSVFIGAYIINAQNTDVSKTKKDTNNVYKIRSASKLIKDLANKKLRLNNKKVDTVPIWTIKNNFNLHLSENAYVNWSRGGENSISGLARIEIIRNYKKGNLLWNNTFKASYGLNQQQDRELRKTEDQFEFKTSFGYKTGKTSNWYYIARFSINSQFSNGYNYPNIEQPISRFFAPGYTFIGIGTEYSLSKYKIDLYFSPLTNKITYVLDQTLANQGAFGVEKATYDSDGNLLTEGEKINSEVGILINVKWKTKIMDNITMNNLLSLYSDYINNFGNIDIDWETTFDMKINKYMSATLGTHFLYDDDIKTELDEDEDGVVEQYGPKLQFKQLLSVGFTYSF